MSASDHINEFQKMYHLSPVENRESIQKYGILSKFDKGDMAQTGEIAPAVFLAPKYVDKGPYLKQDLWEVDTSGLRMLEESPDMSSEFSDIGGSYEYTGDIDPSKISLKRKGNVQ